MREATRRSWLDFSRWLQHAEIASAILLAVASIITAWSAYQSTRWSGVESAHNIAASSARVESTREFTYASQRYAIDSLLFSQWVNAYAAGDERLTAFYHDRLLSEGFIPTLDLWIAQDPLNNPDAPRNPLVEEEYRAALVAPSLALIDKAETNGKLAQAANGHADNYVLTTVVCASVLFFAGIANKFSSRNIKATMLVLAAACLTGALGFVISLPVH